MNQNNNNNNNVIVTMNLERNQTEKKTMSGDITRTQATQLLLA